MNETYEIYIDINDKSDQEFAKFIAYAVAMVESNPNESIDDIIGRAVDEQVRSMEKAGPVPQMVKALLRHVVKQELNGLNLETPHRFELTLAGAAVGTEGLNQLMAELKRRYGEWINVCQFIPVAKFDEDENAL